MHSILYEKFYFIFLRFYTEKYFLCCTINYVISYICLEIVALQNVLLQKHSAERLKLLINQEQI